jgi:hypothetical protein
MILTTAKDLQPILDALEETLVIPGEDLRVLIEYIVPAPEGEFLHYRFQGNECSCSLRSRSVKYELPSLRISNAIALECQHYD